MNGPFRTILTVLLLLVFASSSAMVIRRHVQSSQSARSNEEAREMAFSSSQSSHIPLPSAPSQETGVPTAEADLGQAEENDNISPIEALQNVDISQLQKVNPDIFGWILIPDTSLSYPLLQSGDNQYYLNHNWKLEEDPAGSIFMECQCNQSLDDFNTILYGHRMRDGSMFAGLKHYEDQEFWRAHPSVYLVNGDGLYSYDIFAAWEAGVTEAPFRLQISDEKERLEFIQVCVEQSVITTGIRPKTDDQILTLATCTGAGYNTRWVVQAVKR